jgi:serine protein kinase
MKLIKKFEKFNIFDKIKSQISPKSEEMSIIDYLNKCSEDKSYYLPVADRILKAIGEPVVVDTKDDSRLSRIFYNKKIKVYPAFKDFYGMETVIEDLVSFFKHSSQGLEEKSKFCIYLVQLGLVKVN